MKKNFGTHFVLVLWLALALFAWLKPAAPSSDAERRPLAQFPALSAKTLLSGRFMSEFSDYAVDQFPLRDTFRSLKALTATGLFAQKDNNGIYIADGAAAKMEYPLNSDSLANAAERFQALYDAYLQEAAQIHFALVPDKGYYLADSSGHLALDYDAMTAALETALPWAEFIDLTGTLDAGSYYRTDTHWRQEALLPTAKHLSEALGVDFSDIFTAQTLTEDFRGVYAGQSALPLAPDKLEYLTWPGWEECSVWSLDTGKSTSVYDLSKETSRDRYDIFLSGGMALQVITNPRAEAGRKLIVFRDSFGSSLIPLLVPQYESITLIDTRYISPALLGNYVNFQDADVLMLYSTLILNSSGTLRK